MNNDNSCQANVWARSLNSREECARFIKVHRFVQREVLIRSAQVDEETVMQTSWVTFCALHSIADGGPVTSEMVDEAFKQVSREANEHDDQIEVTQSVPVTAVQWRLNALSAALIVFSVAVYFYKGGSSSWPISAAAAICGISAALIGRRVPKKAI